MTRILGLLMVLALAACTSSAPTLTIPEYDLDTPAPAASPRVTTVAPRLVPYPDLDVSYVANADGEVLWHRGVFYTLFNDSWFHARGLRGPWTFIEMKDVPGDLFRAHGRKPPGVR
jgi:hypothetical protein